MDDDQIIQKIYLATSLTTDIIPRDVWVNFIAQWKLVFPDSECLVCHNVVVSLYEWGLKQSALRDSSGGGKIREKEGLVEIELDEVDKTIDWQNALNKYLESPDAAFPQCKDELGVKRGRVVLGGTSKSRSRAVRRNRDSRNQYDERSPYQTNTRRRCSRTGFTCEDDDYCGYNNDDCC